MGFYIANGLGETIHAPSLWKPGIGYVRTAEREAEIRVWHDRQDREFYDSLGEERPNVLCRTEGCWRGAITHSVLRRPHHFEMIEKRASPFHD